MEQEMTTRLSIRPQDIVAQLSGGVGANTNTAARVERDLYLIGTPVAAVCACERRNAATIQDLITINRSHGASADRAGGNQNRLFLLRPLKGAAAADLPVVIAPWDQIEPVRMLERATFVRLLRWSCLGRAKSGEAGSW
jgi:hypothetical protein